MKMYSRAVYIPAITITMFLAAFPIIRAEPEPNPIQENQKTQVKPGTARTIPKSGTVITLKFTFDNGESMLISQKDGGMIRIEKGDQILGFTPYLPEGNDGPVALRVFQVNRVIKGGKFLGEKMVEQETFDFSNNFVGYKISDLSSTIQLANVRPKPTNSPEGALDSTFRPFEDESSFECCVSCNGVRACACGIVAGCGSCCVGDCCG